MATVHWPSQQRLQAWLPGCAPMHLIIGVIFLALIQTVVAVEWQLKQPYFRLPLQWQGDRIVLMEHMDIPINQIGTEDISLVLPAQALAPDPDFFNSFKDLNAFYAQQDAFYLLLNTTHAVRLQGLDTASYRYSRVEKQLNEIPPAFWIYQFFAGLALLIGTAFWAFHRHQAVTRILVLASAGFALMQWTMALYSTREVALAASTFKVLVAMNHFGGMLFAACTVALLLFQPVRLPFARALPVAAILLLLCWLNEQAQWIEWPINIFYFPSLLLLLVFILLAGIQLYLCRSLPPQRKQLLWLASTLLVGLGLAFAFYIVPLFLSRTTWLSLTAANGIALLIFIGFVLGVQRNELFGVHRWWLSSWIVSGAALVLIVVDISALITFSKHAQWGLGAMSFAMAWMYLPLRQQVWRRYVIGGNPPSALPIQHPQDEAMLQQLLERFKPLYFTCAEAEPQAMETQQGLVLVAPLIHTKKYWIFIGKMRGFSRFSEADTVAVLEQLRVNNTERAVTRERERIMRDLHDDIAADLLTLLHEAETESRREQVSETLHNLRAIIYSLQPDQTRSLSDYCKLWQEDVLRRCRIVHCDAQWQQQDSIGSFEASPAQALHLQRMLREAVSNALRHAKPSQLQVALSTDKTHLYVRVTDNGHHKPLENWRCGKGLLNLQERAHELQGQAQWHLSRNHLECHFCARIPLQQFIRIPPEIVPRKFAHAENIAA